MELKIQGQGCFTKITVLLLEITNLISPFQKVFNDYTTECVNY